MPTLKEINSRRLGRRLTTTDVIFYSPDSWGDRYYGSWEDWLRFIPEREEDEKRAAYQWYTEDDRGLSWAEYRGELLDELEII